MIGYNIESWKERVVHFLRIVTYRRSGVDAFVVQLLINICTR